MQHFAALVSLWCMYALAHAQTVLVQSSPWVQQAPNGWVNTISPQNNIVLMATPQGLYFTAYAPCPPGSIYTETFTWQHGQPYATGVSCAGVQVRRPITHWQPWVHPLPHGIHGYMEPRRMYQPPPRVMHVPPPIVYGPPPAIHPHPPVVHRHPPAQRYQFYQPSPRYEYGHMPPIPPPLTFPPYR